MVESEKEQASETHSDPTADSPYSGCTSRWVGTGLQRAPSRELKTFGPEVLLASCLPPMQNPRASLIKRGECM